MTVTTPAGSTAAQDPPRTQRPASPHPLHPGSAHAQQPDAQRTEHPGSRRTQQADPPRALHPGPPSGLPPALRGWSAAFAALTPVTASGLAPLLHRLDELFARHGDTEAPAGEPAGLAGLTYRGLPERLLVSEWLLADELPEEFLRRAAMRELLHLDTAYRHAPPAGTSRVVVDVGPAQAGVARLVQLAVLIVLHRRAADRGSTLEVGVLGEPEESWHTGDLPELLRAWQTARHADEPVPAQVEARARAARRAWFLLSPALASRLPAGTVPARRVLTAREAVWAPSGAVAAEVVLAGERVRLPLPPPEIGISVLRGQAFRPTTPRADTGPGSPCAATALHVRHAAFRGTVHQLVGRGEDPGDLLVANCSAVTTSTRVLRHHVRGTVIAASTSKNRLVVLHQHSGGVEVTVVGRHLGTWNGLVFPTEVLGLSRDELAAVVAGPPLPLHHSGGTLWFQHPAGWRLVDTSGEVVPHSTVRLISQTGPDTVNLAVRMPTGVLWTRHGTIDDLPEDAPIVAGADWVAAPQAPTRWTAIGPDRRELITTSPGDRVVGLVVLAGEPHLVVLSTGNLLLRLASPTGTRTLTPLSGTIQQIAVHPTLPLMARDTLAGVVEVHDLATGARVGTFDGSFG